MLRLGQQSGLRTGRNTLRMATPTPANLLETSGPERETPITWTRISTKHLPNCPRLIDNKQQDLSSTAVDGPESFSNRPKGGLLFKNGGEI